MYIYELSGITKHRVELTGQPVARGVGEGPATIVRNRTDLSNVRRGDVVLVPTASAKWASSMPAAAGLISGIGGPLASPGTIARECKTPTVFGVGVDIYQVRPGTIVTVNGSLGTVTWFKEEPRS